MAFPRNASFARPQVLLFDVNETLLDMSKLKEAVGQVFGNPMAYHQWFLLVLQHSLVDTVAPPYHDFSELADAGLEMVAQALDRPIKAAEKHKILGLLTKLPPHSDVLPSLERLAKAGFRLVAFTNSTQATLDQQLAYAQLTACFEQRLSVDALELYKPHPNTYAWACRQVGVAASSAMMVAAHGWDVGGARRAGLQGAFLFRPGQFTYPLAPRPAYDCADLIELTDQLTR